MDAEAEKPQLRCKARFCATKANAYRAAPFVIRASWLDLRSGRFEWRKGVAVCEVQNHEAKTRAPRFRFFKRHRRAQFRRRNRRSQSVIRHLLRMVAVHARALSSRTRVPALHIHRHGVVRRAARHRAFLRPGRKRARHQRQRDRKKRRYQRRRLDSPHHRLFENISPLKTLCYVVRRYIRTFFAILLRCLSAVISADGSQRVGSLPSASVNPRPAIAH